MQKKKGQLLFKELHNYNIMLAPSESNKHTSSAAGLRNLLENFGAEIVNNLDSVKNMLQKRLALNLIPMKCREELNVPL